ncbi:unnamed protein product [Hymenolepis diminuta]|uniref:Uncharacterized protein n=1 Tax=Hymenolepis diminuta TaxID=6216 RepID=A0A3P7BC40_HYMDI|nr:unnamed protein product [Hymenolepis diminuta]
MSGPNCALLLLTVDCNRVGAGRYSHFTVFGCGRLALHIGTRLLCLAHIECGICYGSISAFPPGSPTLSNTLSRNLALPQALCHPSPFSTV